MSDEAFRVSAFHPFRTYTVGMSRTPCALPRNISDAWEHRPSALVHGGWTTKRGTSGVTPHIVVSWPAAR